MAAWRLSLNGGTEPHFNVRQNPVMVHSHRFVRMMTYSWLYLLNLRNCVVPVALSPDWSGISIPPVGESLTDWRLIPIAIFYVLVVYWAINLLKTSDAIAKTGVYLSHL